MREGDWTNGCGFSFFCFGFFFSRPRASLFPMGDSLPQLPRFCQSDSPGQSDSPERLTPWRTPRHCVLFRTRTRNRGWDLPGKRRARPSGDRQLRHTHWLAPACQACLPSLASSPEVFSRASCADSRIKYLPGQCASIESARSRASRKVLRDAIHSTSPVSSFRQTMYPRLISRIILSAQVGFCDARHMFL